ncbi:hypothetical protein M0Q97_02040 [Candidatus Dojkabacteria bacterium]|jgi:hypothetical protein|nr:hypothetical protein [Candidatus Dojkabacteria bacterium]
MITKFTKFNEGRIKDKMFKMIEEIVEIYTETKGTKAENIAEKINHICGYDPTNENVEDFEIALWKLDFQDLETILSAIKIIIKNDE